jgi:hypothetical protein
MQDDYNNTLDTGTSFEFQGTVDDTATDIPLEEERVLHEGEYMIHVPEGQKATVVYSLAV